MDLTIKKVAELNDSNDVDDATVGGYIKLLSVWAKISSEKDVPLDKVCKH